MDEEITAMAKISEALSGLDEGAKVRVLRWASDRFEVVLHSNPKKNKVPGVEEISEGDGDDNEEDSSEDQGYDSFADLFVAANPSESTDKLLVAAYWHQVLNGAAEFFSGTLNKDLKDLGHTVPNINKRFDTLMKQKPQLAVQVKRGGNTKQARKKYKLTHAGILKVKQMINTD